jgi:DNA-binding NarL/FixJ family response regulator
LSAPKQNLPNPKKVLLIDLEDIRRGTRVRMLTKAGYDVQLRIDHVDAEWLDHEGHFDLVILSLHRTKLDDAAAYSERLRERRPKLPVLLLLDVGVFVPRGTLSRSMDTGFPVEFMQEIASMLAGSAHIREVDVDGSIIVPTNFPHEQFPNAG